VCWSCVRLFLLIDFSEGFSFLKKNEEIAGFINSGAIVELNLADGWSALHIRHCLLTQKQN
jgi:hypothetical protein